jgi:hypothetical protein
LAIMARPRAGDWLDGEIAGWRAQGIGVIVSLLEAGCPSSEFLGQGAA